MPTNGWTFYDTVHEGGSDWARALEAFGAGVQSALKAASGWPAREIGERVILVKKGDVIEPTSTVSEAVTAAAQNEDVVKVQWDLSQGGTEDAKEPDYMKIRSFQLTAVRGSGLSIYASSPTESEVPQLIAAVRQAFKAVNVEPPAPVGATQSTRLPTGLEGKAGRWNAWRAIDKVISHPVVSGLIVAGLLAALAAIYRWIR